jgi:chloride channel 7
VLTRQALAAGTCQSSKLQLSQEAPDWHCAAVGKLLCVPSLEPAGSSNWFKQKTEGLAGWGTYTYNRDIRDLVACGVVCGVCTAFKAPVGGVLFAMEMSTRQVHS